MDHYANQPILTKRALSGTGPLRESLIDFDDAAGLDLTVPTFAFDFAFGDVPSLKARTSRQAERADAAEKERTAGWLPTDTITQYPATYVPWPGNLDYPLQQGPRANGVSSQPSCFSRDGITPSRTPHCKIEFPNLEGPHPDTLLEDADPQVIVAELNRLLDDSRLSLWAMTKAMREHNWVMHNEVLTPSKTDSGLNSSSAPLTADEDSY
ncbi:hypothetical protein LTR81_024674 [Elasticomyces elasticus]